MLSPSSNVCSSSYESCSLLSHAARASNSSYEGYNRLSHAARVEAPQPWLVLFFCLATLSAAPRHMFACSPRTSAPGYCFRFVLNDVSATVHVLTNFENLPHAITWQSPRQVCVGREARSWRLHGLRARASEGGGLRVTRLRCR